MNNIALPHVSKILIFSFASEKISNFYEFFESCGHVPWVLTSPHSSASCKMLARLNCNPLLFLRSAMIVL